MLFTIEVARGADYKIERARIFEPKNWLYLNGKNSTICINLADNTLVKGQCHAMPQLSGAQISAAVARYNEWSAK